MQQYVSSIGKIDSQFPDRLVAGFRTEYTRLKHGGMNGDQLFFAMLQFAGFHTEDMIMSAATLAVVSYLFATCELFER